MLRESSVSFISSIGTIFIVVPNEEVQEIIVASQTSPQIKHLTDPHVATQHCLLVASVLAVFWRSASHPPHTVHT